MTVARKPWSLYDPTDMLPQAKLKGMEIRYRLVLTRGFPGNHSYSRMVFRLVPEATQNPRPTCGTQGSWRPGAPWSASSVGKKIKMETGSWR